MDPNLTSELPEIRDFSTEVFVILFKRQNEKAFIDPNLDKSIMAKLNVLIANGKQNEVDLLILSLKQILKKSPDLRLQDRILALIGTDGKTVPYTKS
jgi:uncharacterized protein with PhoU and TrkA domain